MGLAAKNAILMNEFAERAEKQGMRVIDAALDGRLAQEHARWDARPAIGVVLVAAGYPGRVRVGDAISGLDTVGGGDLRVFHGATQLDAQQHVTTAGGRVLTVCALGADIEAARATAYQGVDAIDFAGKGYRRDIAHHALGR